MTLSPLARITCETRKGWEFDKAPSRGFPVLTNTRRNQLVHVAATFTTYSSYKRKYYGDLSDDQTTVYASVLVPIMSASSSNDAELLRRTEELLEQDPQGQAAALSGLLQELGTLWNKPATETLEKAFQLFGTAAGKHSKSEERGEVLNGSG
jgi:hypothetical protein